MLIQVDRAPALVALKLEANTGFKQVGFIGMNLKILEGKAFLVGECVQISF